MNNITNAFEITLFDDTLRDACLDIAELGIDSLLDNGIFKSIPIVNSLIGIGKTEQNIHDRNLLRQTIEFINTFNKQNIDGSKLEAYRNKLNSNPKYLEEELGRVRILLNNNVDLKKSEILALFYSAYVNQYIDWNQFCELSDILSRLFLVDLKLLFKIYRKQIKNTTQCKVYQADRLISLGLLDSSVQSMRIGSDTGSKTNRYIQTNEVSNLFCRLTYDYVVHD